MEYYLAVKRNKLLIHATTYMRKNNYSKKKNDTIAHQQTPSV
jgi:hypothetical protein